MPGRYTKLYLYCSKWLKGQFICRWCFGHTTWPRLKLTCCDGIFGNLWQGGACSLWTLAAESDQFKWTFSPNYYIFSQHHLQKYPKNNGIKNISWFIWNNKKPKVKFSTFQLPEGDGGRALPLFNWLLLICTITATCMLVRSTLWNQAEQHWTFYSS